MGYGLLSFNKYRTYLYEWTASIPVTISYKYRTYLYEIVTGIDAVHFSGIASLSKVALNSDRFVAKAPAYPSF